uniref:Uncharacterized protein n=1 Tax=virus sp. ctLTC15 TaxID=2826801 RepID=A0A8S5R8I5_9VIRU|nr:MAG TPA: hypothetical protein [virus sp. ctLTC15]
MFVIMLFSNAKLPYRYFNKLLVLYTDFSVSRQADLMRFSAYSL